MPATEPEVMQLAMKLKDAITSRMKIMAKLDISEKRLPQDGRIKIKMKLGGKNKEMDYRVSVLPTLFGEKIVLRLLDKDNLMLDMTRLGFEQESLTKFEGTMILVAHDQALLEEVATCVLELRTDSGALFCEVVGPGTGDVSGDPLRIVRLFCDRASLEDADDTRRIRLLRRGDESPLPAA